jgi:hypothetical protein
LSQAIYYAPDIGAGSNTVTVAFNQPAAFVDLRATEYSGLRITNTFQAGSSATGISPSADSGAITVSETNTLLFGAGITANAFTSSGSGFSVRAITLPDGDIVEDLLANGPGLYHATAGLNTGAWLMQVASFGAAAPSITPTLTAAFTPTNTLLITWPANTSGFTLQQTSQLEATHWIGTTNPIVLVGPFNQVIVSPSAGRQFYRLRGQ